MVNGKPRLEKETPSPGGNILGQRFSVRERLGGGGKAIGDVSFHIPADALFFKVECAQWTPWRSRGGLPAQKRLEAGRDGGHGRVGESVKQTFPSSFIWHGV